MIKSDWCSVLDELNKVHGGYYRYPYPEDYKQTSRNFIRIECPKHGIFTQRRDTHKNGGGCPLCAKEKALERAKEIAHRGALEFSNRGNKVHNNFYKYPYPEDYITCESRIRIECPKHGEFKQEASSHLRGYGCPRCKREISIETILKANNDKNRQASLSFFERSNRKHNGKYRYPDSYVGDRVLMRIECPKHGIFKQVPGSHLAGRGCPTCKREEDKVRSKAIAQQAALVFPIKAAVVHNNFYKYFDDYVNAKEKVRIECPKHGIFKQTPNSHLSGNGCPICKYSHGEREIWKFLKGVGIDFIPQHYFDDCRGDYYELPFDFYIPSCNLLIEYDGEQHYKYKPGMHQTEKNFELRQKYDKIKNEYALKKGIELLRIRYDEDLEVALKGLGERLVACRI